MRPLVLDFDASVLSVDESETRVLLAEWQEGVRFGCTQAEFARLEAHLSERMPEEYGCVFTGSGDYHHVSLFLLRHFARRRPCAEKTTLVVLDNHPDNMRYLFGLHCGSWVRRAAALDWVEHVHVVGITSGDIGRAHAWENYLRPFVRRKLTYWSIGVDASWLGLIGRADCAKNHASPEALLDALLPVLRRSGRLYLSLDKDVFSHDLVRTNWDQGVFSLSHAQEIIAACSGKLCGADVCGDVSHYEYKGAFKRLLSRLDGQEQQPGENAMSAPTASRLESWQRDQQTVNRQLNALLTEAWAART